MSELLRPSRPKPSTATAAITPVDAVRLVVNTAVEMAEHEPAIDIRSVTESQRGPGVLIWIPGYISNGDTIITAPQEPTP